MIFLAAEYGYVCGQYSCRCQLVKLVGYLGTDGFGQIFCLYLFGDYLGVDVAGAVIVDALLFHALVGKAKIGVFQAGFFFVELVCKFHRHGKEFVVEFYYLRTAATVFSHCDYGGVVAGELRFDTRVENVPVTVAPAVDGLLDIYHQAVIIG